jgi:putative ubiquitin-RnfH superfamily antitoxin RatB of RatAB toxin-antitoxin module
MAHFYGKMKGARGATSRCGTKNSGMTVDVGGWNIGVRVVLTHVEGADRVEIYRKTSAIDPNGVRVYADEAWNE